MDRKYLLMIILYYNSHGEITPNSSVESVMLRETKGRLCVEENPSAVYTLNEQEWQKLEQATVLKKVSLAFDNVKVLDVDSKPDDEDLNDMNGNDVVPSGGLAGDAHTLASLLQQQIDAINRELV